MPSLTTINNKDRAKEFVDFIQCRIAEITENLKKIGCECIQGHRDEYTLYKQEKIIKRKSIPYQKHFSLVQDKTMEQAPRKDLEAGVNSEYGYHNPKIHHLSDNGFTFLDKIDCFSGNDESNDISTVIKSFSALQSDKISLNIGLDSEFQYLDDSFDPDYPESCCGDRLVLSIQMSVLFGGLLVRYFFLVTPGYQYVTKDGGSISLRNCLADVLTDIKRCYIPELPRIPKKRVVKKFVIDKSSGKNVMVNDYKAMSDSLIPVTLICHSGKADISIFSRSRKDVDMIRHCSEIQGGWMSMKPVKMSASTDTNYNSYWFMDVTVRDTMGLTPADGKSLKNLGDVIGVPKIALPDGVIEHMADYLVNNLEDFYEYAMNDSDIVVLFCSEVFKCNHAIPVTLSSATASRLKDSIMSYFGCSSPKEYNHVYRGLESCDDGLIADSNSKKLKYLKGVRLAPLSSNPDARLMHEFCEENYVGGFNASFEIGWFKEVSYDFDIQNAYPTAMACVIDIDWDAPVYDFPKNHVLTLDDIPDPLIPAAAVGDFEFPSDTYVPNIPSAMVDGLRIYPLSGRNVYMTGPDMHLALKMGAKIIVKRGFTCSILKRDGDPSRCLAHAVRDLVKDRALAKRLWGDDCLFEAILKNMVNAGYGKTAQNVSPKTRYNAKTLGRDDASPSCVTSPYHASYTTALVRCMLIGCINQLHSLGYKTYSVTTDGFITNAPEDVVYSLNAYGFTKIFQEGRYRLSGNRMNSIENLVWKKKHTNTELLNLTTRGNVGTNDGGVLAHNSYVTGKIKDSVEDREFFLIVNLMRKSKLECQTKKFTKFSDINEKKTGFCTSDVSRYISMNFDYKRCPVVHEAEDFEVSFTDRKGRSFHGTMANFGSRPYRDVEEFLNYRKVVKHEDCIKVKKDLERVKLKSTSGCAGYIGKNHDRKALLSVICGYRAGIYEIPALDGLKQSAAVALINSWNISEISINDWKNCSRSKSVNTMLPYEEIKTLLDMIINKCSMDSKDNNAVENVSIGEFEGSDTVIKADSLISEINKCSEENDFIDNHDGNDPLNTANTVSCDTDAFEIENKKSKVICSVIVSGVIKKSFEPVLKKVTKHEFCQSQYLIYQTHDDAGFVFPLNYFISIGYIQKISLDTVIEPLESSPYMLRSYRKCVLSG